MSTLPTPEQAYDTIFGRVYTQVFFNKIASAGYQPRTQDEVQHIFNTTRNLRRIEESAQVKQASAQENPYFQMSQGLETVMQQYGLGQPNHQESDIDCKQAADYLMNDPEIYNAVLALKAEEYAQQDNM